MSRVAVCSACFSASVVFCGVGWAALAKIRAKLPMATPQKVPVCEMVFKLGLYMPYRAIKAPRTGINVAIK